MRCLLVVLFALSGFIPCFPGQDTPHHWSTGFWFWDEGDFNRQWIDEPLDVVFVQVGRISREMDRWYVYGQFPRQSPPAREYWAVFRCERQSVPDIQTAAKLGEIVDQLRDTAVLLHLKLVGIQLDVDSPTSELSQYASYLREVRKELHGRFPVSIIASLDWFRPGTDVGAVLKEADEFVPQFYGVGDEGNTAIAEKVDATRWGPVFNRFGKPFRIGISSFGRARFVPREGRAERGLPWVISMYRDLAPIDLATNSAFQLQASRNQANELVLTYRAIRKVRFGYEKFDVGDTMEYVLATPDTIRGAVESARKMDGHSAGVVFFRWPGFNEALAMDPRDVLAAAGANTGTGDAPRNTVEVVDRGCAVVQCVDVFLNVARPFSGEPARYGIRSSAELEYFLPQENIPIRMTGPSRLELSLPAYSGRPRLYLGTAVSLNHSEFTVEEASK